MPDPVAEVMEVDIFDQKVSLPKDQALALIAKRDASKNERNADRKRIGEIEATARLAEQQARDAATALEAEKAAKANDQSKLKELYSRDTKEKLEKLSKFVSEAELKSAASRLFQGLDSNRLSDIVALNLPRLRFNADTQQVEVLELSGQVASDEAGKPVSVDSLLAAFAKDRDYFKPQKMPGRDGKNVGTTSGSQATEHISKADKDGLIRAGKWTKAHSRAIADGTLVVDYA